METKQTFFGTHNEIEARDHAFLLDLFQFLSGAEESQHDFVIPLSGFNLVNTCPVSTDRDTVQSPRSILIVFLGVSSNSLRFALLPA